MARPPKNMFAIALRVSPKKNWRKNGTIQIPVDSSEETPGGGRMVI
jgi:hypothetical protein